MGKTNIIRKLLIVGLITTAVGWTGSAMARGTTGQDPVAGTFIPIQIGGSGGIDWSLTTDLTVQSYTWYPTYGAHGVIHVVFSEDVDFSDAEALKKTLVIGPTDQGAFVPKLVDPIAISNAVADKGHLNEVNYTLAENPSMLGEYEFRILSGTNGPKTASGKTLKTNLTWNHQFTAAELGITVQAPTEPYLANGMKIGGKWSGDHGGDVFVAECDYQKSEVIVAVRAVVTEKINRIESLGCMTVKQVMEGAGDKAIRWTSKILSADPSLIKTIKAPAGYAMNGFDSSGVWINYPDTTCYANFFHKLGCSGVGSEGDWVTSLTPHWVRLKDGVGLVGGSLTENGALQGNLGDLETQPSSYSYGLSVCPAGQVSWGLIGYLSNWDNLIGVTGIAAECADIKLN